MDYQRKSNGILTFVEHFGFMGMTVSAVVAAWLFSFFTRLTGTPWVWCYGIGLFLACVGVALIFYSKLPLYRQRRFFTFGSAALPEARRSAYRWGYRCVLFAVALLLCLFLSRH